MPKGEKVVLPDEKPNPWGFTRGKDVDVASGPRKDAEGNGGEKNLGGGGDVV